MKRLQLVNAGLGEHLEVKVLQSQMLIRFGLIVLIVFDPGRLQHSLKCYDRHPILLILLEHLAHLLIDNDGLLVVVRVLHEVSQVLEHLHRPLPQLHLLKQNGKHERMLNAENVLVEHLNDGHIRVNCQEGLLPVSIA